MITNTSYTMKETITLTGEEINELFIAIGSELKSCKSALETFEKLELPEMKRVTETQIERLNSIFDKLSEAEKALQAKYDRKWYGVF